MNLEEYVKEFQADWEKAKKDSQTTGIAPTYGGSCPCCGRCPHCGGGYYPYYPKPYTPYCSGYVMYR